MALVTCDTLVNDATRFRALLSRAETVVFGLTTDLTVPPLLLETYLHFPGSLTSVLRGGLTLHLQRSPASARTSAPHLKSRATGNTWQKRLLAFLTSQDALKKTRSLQPRPGTVVLWPAVMDVPVHQEGWSASSRKLKCPRCRRTTAKCTRRPSKRRRSCSLSRALRRSSITLGLALPIPRRWHLSSAERIPMLTRRRCTRCTKQLAETALRKKTMQMAQPTTG